MNRTSEQKSITYEVGLYTADSWDDENDWPEDLSPVVMYDGEAFPRTFDDIDEAYDFFRKNSPDFSANGLSTDLSAVGEKNRLLAWDYVCGSHREKGRDSEALDAAR